MSAHLSKYWRVLRLTIALLLFAMPILAGDYTFSGVLSANSPTWFRPASPGDLSTGSYSDPTNCSLGRWSDWSVSYDTHRFKVSQAGDYHIALTANFDGYLALYSEDIPFTADGSSSCIIALDDSPSTSCCPSFNIGLVPDLNYTLVVTSYDEDDSGTYSVHVVGPGDIYTPDERINNRDPAAPIFVYPHFGGLVLYYPSGLLVFHVTAEELDAIAECPETNTLIAATSDLSVALYSLSSCEYQINAVTPNGKVYVMIFSNRHAVGQYISYELE
jgi:hypothetical protein